MYYTPSSLSFLRHKKKTIYEDLSLRINIYSPKLQNATLNKFDDFTYLHNKNHRPVFYLEVTVSLLAI